MCRPGHRVGVLFERYRRRLIAFAAGMVGDHGRAEEVTQEVFISALRRLRATDAPIAFKPWIYEIARNACIDTFRRSRGADEVSLDVEEARGPASSRGWPTRRRAGRRAGRQGAPG